MSAINYENHVTTIAQTHSKNNLKPYVQAHGHLYIFLCSIIPFILNLFFYFSAENETIIRWQVWIFSFSVVMLLAYLLFTGLFVRRIALFVFLIANFVWFALPALYQTLIPGLWFGDWLVINLLIPLSSLKMASLLISCFFFANFAFLITVRESTAVHLDKSLPSSSQSQFVFSNGKQILLVVLFFFIGIFPILMNGESAQNIILQLLSGRTDKSWALSPQSVVAYAGSLQQTLFWVTRAFLLCAGTLAGSYFIFNKTCSLVLRGIYGIVFILSGILVFFDQGTRSALAMLVVPVFLLYILKQDLSSLGKRIKWLYSFVIIVVVLLFISQLQMFYREERTRSLLSDITISEILATRQQTDFFTETAIAVNIRDNFLGWNLNESPLSFFITNLIPRAIWPEKPKSMVMWQYSWYRWGIDIWQRGGNALPSVVGQYYMSFGFLGVIWVGILYGTSFGLVQKNINSSSKRKMEQRLLLFTVLSFLFVSFRFLSPGLHYSSFLLWMLLIISKLFKTNNGKVL